MKVTVDRTKCEGYAKCIQASPKVFKLDAKMIAEVIDPKGDTDEKILLAKRKEREKKYFRWIEGFSSSSGYCCNVPTSNSSAPRHRFTSSRVAL